MEGLFHWAFDWLINLEEILDSKLTSVFALAKEYEKILPFAEVRDESLFYYLRFFHISPSMEEARKFIEEVQNHIAIDDRKSITDEELPNILQFNPYEH